VPATTAKRCITTKLDIESNATAAMRILLRNCFEDFIQRIPILSVSSRGIVCPSHSRREDRYLTSDSILAGTGFLFYSNYIYHSYIIGAFHQFPEPVAKQMRKAIYYTNYSLEPRLAVKYYREALKVADEIGMDPFSDEIIGVKIQLAAMFEKIQEYKKAIDILEIVKSDNLLWVEKLGSLPGNEGKRTRVLGKTVGVSVKLGELYANQYVNEKEVAESRLVWAVETVLKEQERREKEGVKEGEGEWLSAEQIGGSLEALGHHYEEKNQHYLAAPLFLNALSLSPPSSCHTAVLSKHAPLMLY
jgi:hypothetical protein